MSAGEKFAPGERFGERAAKMGLVTKEQVEKALKIQKQLARKKKPHRLTGLILLDMGAIQNAQLLRVLKTYEKEGKKVE